MFSYKRLAVGTTSHVGRESDLETSDDSGEEGLGSDAQSSSEGRLLLILLGLLVGLGGGRLAGLAQVCGAVTLDAALELAETTHAKDVLLLVEQQATTALQRTRVREIGPGAGVLQHAEAHEALEHLVAHQCGNHVLAERLLAGGIRAGDVVHTALVQKALHELLQALDAVAMSAREHAVQTHLAVFGRILEADRTGVVGLLVCAAGFAGRIAQSRSVAIQ
mmetsp:Transcript_15682/g.47012  ORF Transcript_15682/g.47012 Transcript_15682/m.47012 type:complete len:221 (+) Transcript_15682:327-989(+)